MGTVLLKDEEIATYLLLTVFTLILTWLNYQTGVNRFSLAN